MQIAVDTNILVHMTSTSDPRGIPVIAAWRKLETAGHEFCATPQNLIEFWSVATKPVDRNGLGLSPSEAHGHLRFIEASLALLEEDERIYHAWREIVLMHAVRGKQVHDARLAAFFRVHDVSHLLTCNAGDFKRYTWLTAIDPRYEVQG